MLPGLSCTRFPIALFAKSAPNIFILSPPLLPSLPPSSSVSLCSPLSPSLFLSPKPWTLTDNNTRPFLAKCSHEQALLLSEDSKATVTGIIGSADLPPLPAPSSSLPAPAPLHTSTLPAAPARQHCSHHAAYGNYTASGCALIGSHRAAFRHGMDRPQGMLRNAKSTHLNRSWGSGELLHNDDLDIPAAAEVAHAAVPTLPMAPASSPCPGLQRALPTCPSTVQRLPKGMPQPDLQQHRPTKQQLQEQPQQQPQPSPRPSPPPQQHTQPPPQQMPQSRKPVTRLFLSDAFPHPGQHHGATALPPAKGPVTLASEAVEEPSSEQTPSPNAIQGHGMAAGGPGSRHLSEVGGGKQRPATGPPGPGSAPPSPAAYMQVTTAAEQLPISTTRGGTPPADFILNARGGVPACSTRARAGGSTTAAKDAARSAPAKKTAAKGRGAKSAEQSPLKRPVIFPEPTGSQQVPAAPAPSSQPSPALCSPVTVKKTGFITSDLPDFPGYSSEEEPFEWFWDSPDPLSPSRCPPCPYEAMTADGPVLAAGSGVAPHTGAELARLLAEGAELASRHAAHTSSNQRSPAWSLDGWQTDGAHMPGADLNASQRARSESRFPATKGSGRRGGAASELAFTPQPSVPHVWQQSPSWQQYQPSYAAQQAAASLPLQSRERLQWQQQFQQQQHFQGMSRQQSPDPTRRLNFEQQQPLQGPVRPGMQRMPAQGAALPVSMSRLSNLAAQQHRSPAHPGRQLHISVEDGHSSERPQKALSQLFQAAVRDPSGAEQLLTLETLEACMEGEGFCRFVCAYCPARFTSTPCLDEFALCIQACLLANMCVRVCVHAFACVCMCLCVHVSGPVQWV